MHDSILYRYTENILFPIVFESFNVYADAMLLINVMLLVTGFCRGKLPHNFKWYIFDSNFYRDKLSLFFKSSILEAWLIPTQVLPSSRYIKWYDYVSAIMSWYKLINLTGAQLGLCQFDRGPVWSLSIWQEPSLVAVNLTGAQLNRCQFDRGPAWSQSIWLQPSLGVFFICLCCKLQNYQNSIGYKHILKQSK